MTLEAGIQVAANPQELSRLATEQFVRLAAAAVSEKRLFTVALAGGSTPRTLYALLANEKEPYRAQLPWERIHFFWGDERHVPPDHLTAFGGPGSGALVVRLKKRVAT